MKPGLKVKAENKTNSHDNVLDPPVTDRVTVMNLWHQVIKEEFAECPEKLEIEAKDPLKIESEIPEENLNCDEDLSDAHESKNFIKEENFETESSNQTNKTSKKLLRCGHCSYKCKWKSDLTTHISCRHNEQRHVKCKKCDFTTKTSDVLRHHMINKHTPNDYEWFCCEQCSYKAKHKSTLQKHILYKHTSEDCIKWRICDQCSYKGKSNSDLNRHRSSVHSTDGAFACDHCSNTYKSQTALKRHLKSHSLSAVVKWFKCDQCACRTRSKLRYEKHFLRHVKKEVVE